MKEFKPKTRTQWYRAIDLDESVEAVPESKLPPKTNIEKYCAYKAGLYDGELPEPKTVDEFYIALDCGLEPAEDDDGKEFIPKTRSQWYRAKALELVEEVPSKEEQVTLVEDFAVTWASTKAPVNDADYSCIIYEQEEVFNESDDITVILNGDEIPYIEDVADESVYWSFKNNTKIMVLYQGESDPPANSVASAYLVKKELLIPPKTNIEKYYAYKAGLYDGELPEPKTVDEYYIALDCGYVPDEDIDPQDTRGGNNR